MWSRRRAREKALGCLSVNIPKGESLCHLCVNTCSLNSTLFRCYHPPHQLSHYGKSVMHVISQKIQFGIDALLPASVCLLEKTRANEGKRKAKWKWQAGKRSNSLWHEALKTPHLHSNTARAKWIAAQSQRKPANNVPQQLWVHSVSITWISSEITLQKNSHLRL